MRRDPRRRLERSPELGLREARERSELAEPHCLGEVVEDVLCGPTELPRRQARAPRRGVPGAEAQEVDARGESEAVDIQAAVRAGALALRTETPRDVAQPLVAEDAGLRPREPLAGGLVH